MNYGTVSRRKFLAMSAAASVALAGCRSSHPAMAPSMASAIAPAPPSPEPLAPGPFTADWDSLKQYQCPDWFRDAKFGMWAHWSAQCVPEQGDWYARNMYIQGNKQYEYHVKTYGHPSQFGFMEIDNLWKAENWDPQKLISMYKRAGAKYFVALANHHDNFDTYDSKYHAWNSVNIGPKKDIIGTWATIARANGLKFGVTNHCSHAWHWFQTAYGYDPEGPMAGVRYDAYRLTKADGVGKWWEGYDPQELYVGPSMAPPDGITTISAMNAYHNKYDRVWHEDIPPKYPEFAANWLLRVKDLINKYQPDLLYYDDTELPFGEIGLESAAHLYNSSINIHGSNQAVLNAKGMKPDHRACLVEDHERGLLDNIEVLPWQTDTCIGNWHYQRDIKYKSVGTVVQMLCDIVSKNGNLLLNIPVRGDGTIDDKELAFVQGLTTWMDANNEGIFATRPWRVFGEGPSHLATTRGMNESRVRYTAKDVRYTTKDGVLYAYLLGIPTEDVVIQTLSTSSSVSSPIASVAMLGSSEQITWTQDANGLTITKPQNFPSADVVGFKIVLKT
jgi:alpha-L-fucosidase